MSAGNVPASAYPRRIAMPPDIRRIAPGESKEYDAAAQLIAATFEQCVAHSMDARGIETFLAYAAAPALRARDAAGCATYVAYDGGALVGVLHVRDGEHISLFFVRPDRHGQGIGHALIERADRTTRLASVNSSTNAVRSYERYGFKASGPEQVSDGIRFVPMRRAAA